jgi:thermitase
MMRSLKPFFVVIKQKLRRSPGQSGMRVIAAAALGALLLVTAVTASPPAYNAVDAEHFFYSGGKAQPLALDTQRIAVRFSATSGPDAIIMSDPELRLLEESGVGEEFRLEVFEVSTAGDAVVSAKLAELNSRTDVEFASPIFYAGGREAILTDELWVRFADDLSDTHVADLVAAYGTEIVKRTGSRPNSYILRVTSESPGDALTVSHAYYENENVISAHPNFVVSLQLDRVPNDTHYAGSWNLNNTAQRGGTAGADIEMPEGWDLATGSSSIIVAVMDGHGVQTGHPDFSGKTVTGYDAYSGDNDPTPPTTCEGHGTSCAGIACAATNNSAGVSGVGWNVKLMGVRIGTDPDCDGGFSTTYAIIEDAFVTVTDRGAHVLSNSWSVGNLDIDEVHDGIIYAKTNGRGGLGCVVCFSTANGDNPTIDYPSRYVECVAVGATNWCDERKRAVNDACNNNEWWWGSNYGPGIDVVAPGMGLWTTDITGAGGYNPGDVAEGDAAGDYTMWFGGTSGACPHVAGLAALVLSVNNSLTANQVQTHIQNGADDMVGLVGEDTAGWDQYMGYGRINVFNTLMLVDQPNLMPHLFAGWDDKIVPRNTSDATVGSCTLPDSLYGNLTSTWLNWAEINSSSVGCPPHVTRAYLDDNYAVGAVWGPFYPNQAGAATNFALLNVRGGLHTLSNALDWDNQVVEKNETDNTYAQQFAWTPYVLASKTPVYRNGPPDKGLLTYPNSDGFQFTYGAISAVGMTPLDIGDDYDVRVHDWYTSPTASFRSYDDWSSAGAGYTDFIIANAWGLSNGKEDIGIYRYNTTGPGSGMYVEQSDYYGLIGVTGYYSQTLPPYNILDTYGVYFSESGNFTFVVENQSGTADLGFGIYPEGRDYCDRYEYLSYSDLSGDGGDEMFTVDIVDGEIYPLAVFKSRTADLSKDVSYRIHIYKTPPNLQPYIPAGWDYSLVPRDRNDATSTSAVLTDSLPGDTAGTYINVAWWNAGPDTAGQNRTYIFRDGAVYLTTTSSFLGAGQWIHGRNWGPYNFESGRHALQEWVDYLDWVLETDEDDNDWDMQFAWTPVVLASDVPTLSGAPPDPGAYAYPNCDGYQLAGGWWNAVGMIPFYNTDDYDLHLHMPYAGSLDGYGTAYELSFALPGHSDFVIFNGNNAAVGYGATMDVSVYVEEAPLGGNYYVEGEATIATYTAPTTISSQSLDADEILDIFEVWFGETGHFVVELIPASGDANVGISMYDFLGSYMDKSETLPGAYANENGSGEPEMFTVQIDTAGYYGLVVWKALSWDLLENMTYSVSISRMPPNLTYSTPAGWSYPFTPRSTGDASTYYAPLSSQLWGDSVATWVNVSWANVGPDTAGPHETHCFLDGGFLTSMRRVAPLAPAGSLFVTNIGPVTVRGGRHTLSESVDILDEVLETDETDNVFSRQFVWAPPALGLDAPELRPTPPSRGTGTHPNCDGYYVHRAANWTYVTAMCPFGDEDYDLLLYNDYTDSESGFSNLVASSMMGSGQTEFVGSRYNASARYPAAVQPLPVKGDAGGDAPPEAPLASAIWVHSVSSAGWVFYNFDLPVEIEDQFIAYEIASVYDVELDVGDYDFHLVNRLGSVNLGLAIMPISAGYYARADAAVEANTGGPGDDEFVTFTSAEAGWYEVVVFKDGYEDMSKGGVFELRIGEAGVAGVWSEEHLIPDDFTIEQNRPNPFRGLTTVRYGVPNAGAHVKLSVYDAGGRHVATLADGSREAGFHDATWDGNSASGKPVSSGIYFCRFEAGGRTLTKQMLLLK